MCFASRMKGELHPAEVVQSRAYDGEVFISREMCELPSHLFWTPVYGFRYMWTDQPKPQTCVNAGVFISFFGCTASPFLCGACLTFHREKALERALSLAYRKVERWAPTTKSSSTVTHDARKDPDCVTLKRDLNPRPNRQNNSEATNRATGATGMGLDKQILVSHDLVLCPRIIEWRSKTYFAKIMDGGK